MPEIKKHDDVAWAFANDEAYLDRAMYVEDIDSFAFYDERNGYYKILTEFETRKMFYDYLRGVNLSKGITESTIRDVISLTKYEMHRRRDNALSHYIAFKDKTINLRTLQYEDHSPEHHAFQFVNVYASDIDLMRGNTPLFTDFIQTSLVFEDTRETDRDLVTLMQEIFGYLILDTLDKHHAFFFLGGGANGKSVCIDIIRQLVGGDRFCLSASLEYLTRDNHAASELIGKRVNLCTEDESEYIRPDRFKALVAGETITAARKYLSAVTFKSTTKFVFNMNHGPNFSKIDDGITRRAIIVPWNRKFKEKEQITRLAEKIIDAELPGIVAWAIDGAKRLREQKMVFTRPRQVEDQTRLLEESASSSIQFVREIYEENETSFISVSDMYELYSMFWCGQNGRKAQSKMNFSKDITRVFGNSSVRYFQGKNMRGYAIRQKI